MKKRRSVARQARSPTTRQRKLDRLFAKRQQMRRLMTRRCESGSLPQLLAGDLMSTDVVTVSATSSSSDAAAIMSDRNIHHLLVVNRRREPIGVIRQGDLSKCQAKTVREIMISEPITVIPDAPATLAITIMLTQGTSCLPVVDSHGKLCGILTATDLLLSYQCTLQTMWDLDWAQSQALDGNPGGWEDSWQEFAPGDSGLPQAETCPRPTSLKER